jgi:adenylosuccinate synthase
MIADKLYMMKGMFLSGFDTFKICTAYKYKGKEISHLPYNIEPENVEPVYTEIKKGWQSRFNKNDNNLR